MRLNNDYLLWLEMQSASAINAFLHLVDQVSRIFMFNYFIYYIFIRFYFFIFANIELQAIRTIMMKLSEKKGRKSKTVSTFELHKIIGFRFFSPLPFVGTFITTVEDIKSYILYFVYCMYFITWMLELEYISHHGHVSVAVQHKSMCCWCVYVCLII